MSLLEPKVNEETGNKAYPQKKFHYAATDFSTIKKLVLDYPTVFDKDKVNERTETLCKYYYENILGLII